jgi:hypothetical protein
MDSISYLNLEYFFLQIYKFFADFHVTLGFIDAIRPYSTVISLLLGVGIVYSLIRLNQIRRAERAKFIAAAEEAAQEESVGARNEKWQRVLEHIESNNPNDWRLAIMEADIILDEMMDIMGYHGENLGEKLKSVERSDFTTIDLAWEAHRVRNQIAHEGADFLLSEREARRVINLYRQVFEEFSYI